MIASLYQSGSVTSAEGWAASRVSGIGPSVIRKGGRWGGAKRLLPRGERCWRAKVSTSATSRPCGAGALTSPGLAQPVLAPEAVYSREFSIIVRDNRVSQGER